MTMKTMLFTTGLTITLALAAAGCGKKKAADINAVCEDVFAKAEKSDGKWSPGKGDKAKFMEYCVKQKPAVVACSSMEIDFTDEKCKKLTGVMADDKSGFATKQELGRLRDGQ